MRGIAIGRAGVDWSWPFGDVELRAGVYCRLTQSRPIEMPNGARFDSQIKTCGRIAPCLVLQSGKRVVRVVRIAATRAASVIFKANRLPETRFRRDGDRFSPRLLIGISPSWEWS